MRYLIPELADCLKTEHKMAFIAGPRQVGKTTLVKDLLKKAGAESQYFNWDVPANRKKILKTPDSFWQQALGPTPNTLVLDEIHKYPRWCRSPATIRRP